VAKLAILLATVQAAAVLVVAALAIVVAVEALEVEDFAAALEVFLVLPLATNAVGQTIMPAIVKLKP